MRAASPGDPRHMSSEILGRRRLAVSVRGMALAAGVLASLLVPRVTAFFLEAEAAPLFQGDPGAERAAALGAASWSKTRAEHFSTGAELYDREWAFGAPMMRLAFLSQVSLRHPQLAAELAVPIRNATEDVLSEEARRFTTMKWGSDPLATDATDHHHAAYLGYAGIALGLARATGEPAALRGHEIVIARLRSRAAAAQGAWLRTYPGEIYPPDVAATIGALALAARLDAKVPHDDELVMNGLWRIAGAVDPKTHMLDQAIDAAGGGRADGPRGSGTFLASYFLLPADADLSRSLYEAGRRELLGSALGFVAMRERPDSAPGGSDIDSGPILFGFGVSSTGFALAPARAFGDRETFSGLYATATLFGVPVVSEGNAVRHLSGGPLGDAILCAMATAATPDELQIWTRGDRS